MRHAGVAARDNGVCVWIRCDKQHRKCAPPPPFDAVKFVPGTVLMFAIKSMSSL